MASKVLSGKVVSVGMKNTVVIEVERRIQHPMYKKLIKKNKKMLADTNNIELIVGDVVRIQETRPLSKNKNFRVIEKS